jgi:predicted esterase
MRKHAMTISLPAAGLAVSLLVFGSPNASSAPAPEEFVNGKVIEKVICRDVPDQNYALYLPSEFVPTVKRPILFLFDPTAQGPTAVEVFRPAAEKFGWILAASNNSQNGPVEPNVKAARAMFLDSMARLPIDGTRIYAGGFSGGSRVASLFALAVERRIAGVIGIAAGISPGVKLKDIGIASYFGIAGLADFNYLEMKQLDADLAAAEIPHRVLFYEGPHQWPDSATSIRALGWMEVMAIKQGSKTKDDSLIDEILGKEMADAVALSTAGKVYWAARQYGAIARLFEGLRDVAGPSAEAKRLEQSAEYADFLKKEKRRDVKDASVQQDFARALAFIQKSPEDRVGFFDILRGLRLSSLRKEAQEAGTLEDRSLALRRLFLLSVETSRRGYASYAKDDFLRASSYYELAAESCLKGDARLKLIFRNLGSMYSLLGDTKTALKNLETAADNGFADIHDLETDTDLAKVRDTAGFRIFIERLKKK